MASESRTVSLPVLARIGLDNWLAEQKGNRNSVFVLHNIRQKVKLSDEEKEMYTRQVGNALLLSPAAQTAAAIQVTLESEEVRRLKQLANESEIPTVFWEWLEPLVEQLEAPATVKVHKLNRDQGDGFEKLG